ncbi:MAG: type II secretion system protein J, partial [Candidatus Omnitrophota bacterium]
MHGALKNKKGFTFVEVIFVAITFLLVMGAVLSSWLFTQETWTGERERTHLRVDLMKALEIIKSDLRLSDLNNIVYYPDAGPYTAISLPVAETDSDGFFTLDADEKIDWDKTVIYHLFTDAGGNEVLRRTVYDPRDNTLTDAERETQLENVVTSGTGSGSDWSTDTEFLENVDIFEISSLSTIIDFYTDSSTPVRSDKVVFGWARFNDGDHTIRFEVTGKNTSSSDYNLGIDNIMIEPSGSSRELEYYDSAGILTESGGTASRVYDPIWSNKNYLEFDTAGGVGDYIEFIDHYDLWRESAFESVTLDNTTTAEEEVRIEIDVPEDDEGGEVTWFASQETGDMQSEGRDGSLPWGSSGQGVTVRTLVSSANITEDGDLVRVKLQTYEGAPLLIERAYITRKDDTSSDDYDGYPNLDPSGRTIEEYHRHQQLFFEDTYDYDNDTDTDEVTPRAW